MISRRVFWILAGLFCLAFWAGAVLALVEAYGVGAVVRWGWVGLAVFLFGVFGWVVIEDVCRQRKRIEEMREREQQQIAAWEWMKQVERGEHGKE